MYLDLCLKSKQERRNKNKEFRLPHSIMNELEFGGALRLTIKRNLLYKRRFQTVTGAKVLIYFVAP